jgi:hypothetical protein
MTGMAANWSGGNLGSGRLAISAAGQKLSIAVQRLADSNARQPPGGEARGQSSGRQREIAPEASIGTFDFYTLLSASGMPQKN